TSTSKAERPAAQNVREFERSELMFEILNGFGTSCLSLLCNCRAFNGIKLVRTNTADSRPRSTVRGRVGVSSMKKRACAYLALALPILVLLACASGVFAQTASIGSQLTSDFKYVANNTANDVIDVVTAPLHLEKVPEVLSSPKFYLVLGGAGALWGGSFALDQTMRSHLRSMS